MSNVSSIRFSTDSSLAVSKIDDPSVYPAQLVSILFILHTSHILGSPSRLFISLEWAPGHAGVMGNKETDRIAKIGSIINKPTGHSSELGDFIFVLQGS